MKGNAALLKILSVAPPLHDASDGFNCPNYEKGKKLEIAQITAFSCLSAACLLTGKNTANNCVGAWWMVEHQAKT